MRGLLSGPSDRPLPLATGGLDPKQVPTRSFRCHNIAPQLSVSVVAEDGPIPILCAERVILT